MNGPKRIQRRRTKGWRMPPDAVYVGRPGFWGNPCRCATRARSVEKYRAWLRDTAAGQEVAESVTVLAGRDLACWCPLEDEQGNRVPCHADVLLELANGGRE